MHVLDPSSSTLRGRVSRQFRRWRTRHVPLDSAVLPARGSIHPRGALSSLLRFPGGNRGGFGLDERGGGGRRQVPDVERIGAEVWTRCAEETAVHAPGNMTPSLGDGSIGACLVGTCSQPRIFARCFPDERLEMEEGAAEEDVRRASPVSRSTDGDDVRFPSFHDPPMKWKNERRRTNQWMSWRVGLQAPSPFRLQTHAQADWEMGLPRSLCGWLPGRHRGRGDYWGCPLDPSGGLQHDPNTGWVSVFGFDPLPWSPRSPIRMVHHNNEVVCLKKAGKAGRGRTGDARGGVHGRGTCIVQHRRK
eukprot:scaffold73_cov337-Pavlova_lutheri.AAC.59